MLLFFSFFLFFNLNFLAGTIQTDKVHIDTREIVDSSSKLITTSKTLAFNYAELDLLKMAPEASFLRRLFEKENLLIKGLNDIKRIQQNGINRYAMFSNQNALVYFLEMLSSVASELGSVAFVKSTSYYERLVVYHMRRALDKERKQFINSRLVPVALKAIKSLKIPGPLILSFLNRVDMGLEFGTHWFLTLKLREWMIFKIKQNVEVYEMIEDYVESVSSRYSPDLKLDNAKNLFLYFGGFLVLVFLFFFLDIFLLKQLKAIHRKLIRGLAMLTRKKIRKFRDFFKEKLIHWIRSKLIRSKNF